jgi:hypothetical protein
MGARLDRRSGHPDDSVSVGGVQPYRERLARHAPWRRHRLRDLAQEVSTMLMSEVLVIIAAIAGVVSALKK